MRLIACAAMIFLASCADLTQGTPAGGILKVTGNRNGKALELAQAHCAKYGKDARISGQNALNNTVAFDCVAHQ